MSTNRTVKWRLGLPPLRGARRTTVIYHPDEVSNFDIWMVLDADALQVGSLRGEPWAWTTDPAVHRGWVPMSEPPKLYPRQLYDYIYPPEEDGAVWVLCNAVPEDLESYDAEPYAWRPAMKLPPEAKP